MKIDAAAPIMTLDDTPYQIAIDKDVLVTLSLGRACAEALLHPKPGLTQIDLISRHGLAVRLNKGGDVDLTADDAVAIKTGAMLAYANQLLVAAQIVGAIDAADSAKT